MQLFSRARHPLKIKAVAKSSEGTTPRTLEETLPHFPPENRRHRSRIGSATLRSISAAHAASALLVQGRCDNHRTIRRDEVEARVLRALQDQLLRQDLFEEFCDEFTREIERIEVRQKKLIEMVMDGVAPSVVKDELNANAFWLQHVHL